MMCTVHKILFGCSTKKNEIGGACSNYETEESCMQGFGRET
jgi:hypothetical protein